MDRKQIEAQLAEFLARGGQIVKVKPEFNHQAMNDKYKQGYRHYPAHSVKKPKVITRGSSNE